MDAHELRTPQQERSYTPSEVSPFRREKQEINRRALSICEFVLQSSAEKARNHYALSEVNPHHLNTPLVILSTTARNENDYVGQIRLSKPADEAFEPDNTTTAICLGWCAYTPFKNEDGRNSRYSVEYTMDGHVAYVQWYPEVEKTDHAYIQQVEHDSMQGSQQPLARKNAEDILASMPDTLEYIETTIRNNTSA